MKVGQIELAVVEKISYLYPVLVQIDQMYWCSGLKEQTLKVRFQLLVRSFSIAYSAIYHQELLLYLRTLAEDGGLIIFIYFLIEDPESA